MSSIYILPAVAASVTAGLTFIPWFGNKLGLPNKMSSLIAAGTSICGITAISAVSPVIKATQKDTAFAIANVVLIGTTGLFMYPYLAHYLLENSQSIGIFLGLSVHDTSQVMASGMSYHTLYDDETALKTTILTKLIRNLNLGLIIPYFAVKYATINNELNSNNDTKNNENKFSLSLVKKHTPAFVYGFVGASIFRSIGDYTLATSINDNVAFGIIPEEQWKNVIKLIGSEIGSHYLIGTALAAIGLSTNFSSLKGVGIKPFILGGTGALVVGGTGLTSALLLEKLIL